MHLTVIASFLQAPNTAVGMCAAGIVVLLIGAWAAKNDIAQARGGVPV